MSLAKMTNNDSKKFRFCLILNYYKDNHRSSSFTDLAQIMGLTFDVLDKIIYECFEKNHLQYDEENLLNITETGALFLMEQEMSEFSFKNTKINPLLFDREPVKIEDIYIPKGFTKKVKLLES